MGVVQRSPGAPRGPGSKAVYVWPNSSSRNIRGRPPPSRTFYHVAEPGSKAGSRGPKGGPPPCSLPPPCPGAFLPGCSQFADPGVAFCGVLSAAEDPLGNCTSAVVTFYGTCLASFMAPAVQVQSCRLSFSPGQWAEGQSVIFQARWEPGWVALKWNCVEAGIRREALQTGAWRSPRPGPRSRATRLRRTPPSGPPAELVPPLGPGAPRPARPQSSLSPSRPAEILPGSPGPAHCERLRAPAVLAPLSWFVEAPSGANCTEVVEPA